jgi:hypothetical protein
MGQWTWSQVFPRLREGRQIFPKGHACKFPHVSPMIKPSMLQLFRAMIIRFSTKL